MRYGKKRSYLPKSPYARAALGLGAGAAGLYGLHRGYKKYKLYKARKGLNPSLKETSELPDYPFGIKPGDKGWTQPVVKVTVPKLSEQQIRAVFKGDEGRFPGIPLVSFGRRRRSRRRRSRRSRRHSRKRSRRSRRRRRRRSRRKSRRSRRRRRRSRRRKSRRSRRRRRRRRRSKKEEE